MPDRKLRVFLCHASQDKPVVRELYQRLLVESWIDPWLDEEKLLPGQDWDVEIEQAVEAADVVIVCLSNQSVTKEGYIQRELRFALDIALEKPEGTIFVIPIKLEDCEPPRKLRRPHYVEYFPPEKRDKTFRLMRKSLEIRAKGLGLDITANDPELAISTEPLSSRIISKKISNARQALQNDELQLALEIYEALAKQGLRLQEIIQDLEDVSIVYFNSKELWAVLAISYRMSGDILHAEIYEEKIRRPDVSSANEQREFQSQNYPKERMDNFDHPGRNDKQPTSVTLFLPATISIETAGGVSTPIFYKGDSLPAELRNIFSTATDNQSQVEMHLVLGENKLADDNKSLGRFILDGIPPAPKGVPQIDILVKISQELELNIIATDKATGRTKSLQLAKLDMITPPLIKDPLPPKLENSSTDELFGSGFSDLFQTIFGKRDEASRTPGRSKGHQRSLAISIEEAYAGTSFIIEENDNKKRVYIPAGVQAGSKVRVAGVGPNGLDLFFIISINPHPFFAQSGSDLYMHYPISETFAYHGGELQVPLLGKDKSMLVVIPPNTKDKQVIRFANKGFPKVKEPTAFGDFYLTVDLYDPRNMPQEFKKLLEDIRSYLH